MTAHDRQGCGLGSRILRDCMARLSAAGYHRLRLAVDEGNPQSLAFWTKNGFTLTGEVHPNDFSLSPYGTQHLRQQALRPWPEGLLLHFSFIAASAPPRSDRRTRQR